MENKLNNEEIKKSILKDKSILNSKNINGSSLLQIAIMKNDIDLATFLINKGIDINAQDKKGNTALHYCAEYNQYEIANSILLFGGNLSISDKYGNQPLWTAVFNDKGKNERIEIVKLFMKFGADPVHKNKADKSPKDIIEIAGYVNLSDWVI